MSQKQHTESSAANAKKAHIQDLSFTVGLSLQSPILDCYSSRRDGAKVSK